MRAYLPIRHSDLIGFIATRSLDIERAYAPTGIFIDDNQDCDEEEIEYLLSVLAGQAALVLRNSMQSPGLVLAVELDEFQCGESHEDSISICAPINWSQVQCAFLAQEGDSDLVWFATQEIALELGNWK